MTAGATSPPSPPVDAVVVCLACRRDIDVAGGAGHAVEVAGLHDEARHAGRPVAFVAPVDAPFDAPSGGEHPFGGDAA